MPALTISTDLPRPSRSPSPNRPPVSPITPTLGPTQLASAVPSSDKRSLTHSQPDQTGIPPPPPEPLAFDANPDVIALKSAISILQIQRQKATADIQTLSRAKDAAVGDPTAFAQDLASGKINAPQPDSDSEDDDDEEEDEEMGGQDNSGEGSGKRRAREPPREWSTLPKPQNVVRCPPINWSQYAIVGDSLDKLHAEQVARPMQGTPATIGAGGTYEFTGEGKQERYVGVAAPYNPLQDKLEKKGKGRK